MKEEYPFLAEKIVIVSNPVDLEKMKIPAGFDRAAFRKSQGVRPTTCSWSSSPSATSSAKGLPQLLEAMKSLGTPRLKLCVVGGEQDLIGSYRKKCEAMQLGNQVVFAGMQKDVRPFLWAADGFTLPSMYETFSLVTFEAAAAGLTVIVPPLYGVEEFLVNGENGFLVEPRPVRR